MDKQQRRPKRVEQVVVTDESDVPSILDPVNGRIFLTNAIGKHVMELADGLRSTAEIARELACRFQSVDEGRIHRDVTAFLDDTAEKGLTVWLLS
jgi:hypothetical protein